MALLPSNSSSNQEKHVALGVIGLSFLIALCLSVTPLPPLFDFGRPLWAVLALIYWVIAYPHQVGVIAGWCLGLALDVLYGKVIGQHAFAMAVVAYLSFMLHQRVRLFPAWQQCLSVFVLVGIYQLTVRVIQGVIGTVPEGIVYYLPSVVSALMWPWVYLFFRFVQRYCRMA